jgi:hypothetical protein
MSVTTKSIALGEARPSKAQAIDSLPLDEEASMAMPSDAAVPQSVEPDNQRTEGVRKESAGE